MEPGTELAAVSGDAFDQLMQKDTAVVKECAKLIGYDGVPSADAAEQLGFRPEQVRDAQAFVPAFRNLIDSYRAAKMRDLAAVAQGHLERAVEKGEMSKEESRLHATVNAVYKEARAGERESVRKSKKSTRVQPGAAVSAPKQVTITVNGGAVPTRSIEGSTPDDDNTEEETA